MHDKKLVNKNILKIKFENMLPTGTNFSKSVKPQTPKAKPQTLNPKPQPPKFSDQPVFFCVVS